MAIEKDIAIHSSAMVKQCIEYIDNPEKCSIVSVLEYTQNTNKTTMEGSNIILTSGILCDPGHAADQFDATAKKYRESTPEGTGRGSGGTKEVRDRNTGKVRRVAKESIEAYHIIQSFPEDSGLDPKLVHEIGKEYATAAFPGHQCVVSTHMNTEHLHNHIVVCAYQKDEHKKICMNKAFRHRIRQINDEISIKHGLPILVGQKNRYAVKHSMNEHAAVINKRSFKEDIRINIDKALSKDFVSSWADFVLYMKTFGIEMKETPKNVTYIMKYKDSSGNKKTHRCRDSRLGDRYMRISICNTRGWEYPNEQQQTNYGRFLKDVYNNNASKNDDFHIKKGRLHLHVDRYDENGRCRSLLEITIIIAIKIVQYFWEKHFKKAAYPKHTANKEAVNWDPDKKISMLLEGLEIARTFSIDSPETLKERMCKNGQSISVLGRDITLAEIEYAQVMSEYERLSKKGADPAAIMDFKHRLHDLSGKYSSMKHQITALKQEYALLSKLSHTIKLAKDPVFVLGATTSLSEYPKITKIGAETQKHSATDTHNPSHSHSNNTRISL